MRLPRLLVLASTYPRWAGDPEPGFVHELAKRLTDRFDVTVLCPHSTKAASRELLDGVRVHRYRYAPGRWETLVNDGGILANLGRSPWKWLLVPSFVLGQWMTLFRLTIALRPDVVHAHWLLPQGMVAAGTGANPLVVTSHGADLFGLNGGIFKWLRTKVVKRSAAVTVVSDVMRERLRTDCPGALVLTMPMGVDLDERFVPNYEVPRSTNGILFVGRLVEKKGLIYLVEAMPAVLASHPDAHLDIVGFGPERDRLMGRVTQLGLDECIRFVGAVPQMELPHYYRSAAVFVAPFIEAPGGDQEGLGLVVAEAMGCRCPVLVGDVPAVHDLIGNATDCLVPQRDVDALAKAIIRVLADPVAVARQAAAHHAQICDRFSWTSVAKRYAGLFDTLMLPGERST